LSRPKPDFALAIGHCFSGAVVVHMARFGTEVDGVASCSGDFATAACFLTRGTEVSRGRTGQARKAHRQIFLRDGKIVRHGSRHVADA